MQARFGVRGLNAPLFPVERVFSSGRVPAPGELLLHQIHRRPSFVLLIFSAHHFAAGFSSTRICSNSSSSFYHLAYTSKRKSSTVCYARPGQIFVPSRLSHSHSNLRSRARAKSSNRPGSAHLPKSYPEKSPDNHSSSLLPSWLRSC